MNRGFLSLLAVQFLGAMNDNLLKQLITFMVATGVWSGAVGEGGLGEGGQAVPALCLTLPFIAFSGFAGQLADRFRKNRLILVVKIVEIPIAIVALVGMVTGSLWISMVALLMLGIQSSFFGPAKFGTVPELVTSERLSQANGVLNLLSNLAVIMGALVAGPLSVVFDPKSGNSLGITQPIPWLPGAFMLVVAGIGVVSAMAMPSLPAANPHVVPRWNPIASYTRSLAEMSRTLLTVMLAWSGFYMIAMMALMILPEYESILNIDYARNSWLLGVLGVGVAIGSVTTGAVSGRRIRPTLIPVGAIGMAVSFLVLGALPPTYTSVAVLIFFVGFSAGFYIIPLQALLQFLAPAADRGRFLGTANAMSFLMASAGAGVYWVLTGVLKMNPHRVFLVCGGLAVIGLIVGVVELRRITRSIEAENAKQRALDDPSG